MEVNKVICGDCLEEMKKLPDNCIDLILTDPPYNASNSNIKAWNSFNSVNEEWDKNFKIDYIKDCIRILKPNGSLLVFCSYHLLGEYLTKVPLKLQQIIHWCKNNPMPAITKIYTPNVEYVLWFIKGSPYIFNKTKEKQNIIYTNVLAGKEKTIHPTQKPEKLIRILIEKHSNKNDLVLDCFAGSGTTGVACKQLNRNYILIEKEQKYVDIINKRLQQQTL